MPRQRSEVLGLAWDDFLEWFHPRWKPGDHFSLSALTGAGKSTFMGGLLQHCRKYVLALDIKGGDEIMGALNWPRLESWPGVRAMSRTVANNLKDGKPNRFVVGPIVRERKDRDKLKRCIVQALHDSFDMGGWTVYIDELQVAADRRMLNLESDIAELLVSARQPKKMTICSSFQSLSWVPTEARRQPVWLGASATRDEDLIETMAKAMGRDFHEILGAMRGLDPHTFILVNRNPYDPIVVTKPRKLK